MISKIFFGERFSLETAQALQTWANENLITTENLLYLEPVVIPTYDADNPEHFLIDTVGKYTQANFDIAAYKHYYLVPNDYSSVQITLIRSGTELSRNSISLLDFKDTHPGAMPRDTLNQAKVKIWFSGASYWDLTRLSHFDSVGNEQIFNFANGSTHNTLDRCYASKCGIVVYVRDDCNYNTVQKFRIEDTNWLAGTADANSLIIGRYGIDYVTVIGTKFIYNEILNPNDGIQLTRQPSATYGSDQYQEANFEGTIVHGNKIWLDENVDLTSNIENALDVKAGSMNLANPVIISENTFWGYTTSNSLYPMIVHVNTQGVVFRDNVIFDSNQGFSSGSASVDVIGYPIRYGQQDGEVTGNLFYNCGTLNDNYDPIEANGQLNVLYENNAVIDCTGGYLRSGNVSGDSEFNNNDVCNTSNIHDDVGGSATLWNNSIATTNHYATAILGGYTEDLVIDYDIYTDTPRQITLTNAVKP